MPRGFALVSIDVRGTGASFGFKACDFLPREIADFVEVSDDVSHKDWLP